MKITPSLTKLMVLYIQNCVETWWGTMCNSLTVPAKLNFAIDDVQKQRIISFNIEQGKMKDWGFFYKAKTL